jgi:acetyl esterase/lipase/lysophospholipase L1-like esterase
MKINILFIFFLLINNCSFAQMVIQLYEGKPKGSENWDWSEQTNTQNLFQTEVIYNVSQPTLTAFLPPKEKATGTAVIIAPGGGFHTLSINSEGIDLAKWLNAQGIAAFVLKYRLVRSLTNDPVAELIQKMGNRSQLDSANAPIVPLAMEDGLNAVKYVREHAQDLDIDPQKIGFIGFSAGGTVTMSVVYNATDENRPNFVAPIYAYAGTIIGNTPPSVKTPIFVAVAADDQLGLMQHSIDIFKKWQAAKQPAELHIYERGGHGFGMRKIGLPTEFWYERLGEWLKMQGYLKKRYPSKWELQFTEAQLEAFRKNADERLKNDWAYLKRYADDNKKLNTPKVAENRVVFLGNSITESWVNIHPEFFKQNNYIGRGISGQTTGQTLVRFRQDVIDLKPKAVIINIGTNDIAENNGAYNQDFTFGNIVSMAELAKANGIKVIIASVHPAFEFVWRKEIKDVPQKIVSLNTLLKDYAQKNNFIYLDYHSAMQDNRGGLSPELAEDGVHPTIKGYEIMEKLSKEAIRKTLKK